MKRFAMLLLALFCVSEVLAQDAPSGWTPNYRFRKYASGKNPGADSLNANWTEIDLAIYKLDTAKTRIDTTFLNEADSTKLTGFVTRYMFAADSNYARAINARDTTYRAAQIVAVKAIIQADTLYRAAQEALRVKYSDTTSAIAMRWQFGAYTPTSGLSIANWNTAYSWGNYAAAVGSMAYVDSTKYHGSASITTVGTLAAGSVPMSLVTGQGSMAYVDSTKYHGSASINTVGTLASNVVALGYLSSDSLILGGGGANGVLQVNYYQSGEGGGDWLSTVRFVGTGNRSHWLPDSNGTFVLKEYLKSMAYVDSTKYHGSTSITTLGPHPHATETITPDAVNVGDNSERAIAGLVRVYDGVDFYGDVTSATIGNWNTAYGWGNHASIGYLTAENDPTIYSWAKAATKPSYTYSEVGAAASGHDHSGVYLPVSGAGDIYTHNASEFSVAAHNHSGVYLPVSGAGDIYTHNASEFALAGHNHSGTYHPYVSGSYTGSFTVLDGNGDTMTLSFSNGIFTGYAY